MATFVITPDSHSAFNFIPTMFFGQVLQRLYYKADENSAIRPDGKCTLDIPVFFLMDEFANVSLPDDFDKILSVIASDAFRNCNNLITPGGVILFQSIFTGIIVCRLASTNE